MVNAHSIQRMHKANMIIATCKKKYMNNDDDKGVPVDVLVSMTCLEFGAGQRYVREIIKNLEAVKKILIKEKKAYYIPTEEEIMEIKKIELPMELSPEESKILKS